MTPCQVGLSLPGVGAGGTGGGGQGSLGVSASAGLGGCERAGGGRVGFQSLQGSCWLEPAPALRILWDCDPSPGTALPVPSVPA